jgi:hypothetical protein
MISTISQPVTEPLTLEGRQQLVYFGLGQALIRVPLPRRTFELTG